MDTEVNNIILDADCFDLKIIIQFLKEVLIPLVNEKRSKICPVIEKTIKELEDVNTLFSIKKRQIFPNCANSKELKVRHKGVMNSEMLFRFNFDLFHFRLTECFIRIREVGADEECRIYFSALPSPQNALVSFYMPFEQYNYVYSDFKKFILTPLPPKPLERINVPLGTVFHG